MWKFFFFWVQRKHDSNNKNGKTLQKLSILFLFLFFIIPRLQLELDTCKYPASNTNKK